MSIEPRVYLDHAASTPIRSDVLAAVTEALAAPGNPGSAHAEGRAQKDRLESARSRVAAAWGARPREVVFTASGTVAAQLALVGAARAGRARSPRVVLSAIEHPAVADAGDLLAAEGFEVLRVPPDADGLVPAAAFSGALEDGAAVAALLLANHETGAVQPVLEVAASARARGVPLLVDACLGPGRVASRPADLGADLLVASSHKHGGPAGVGLLYVRRGVRLEPLWRGGRQEEGLHAGTEAVALAVGASIAIERAIEETDTRASRDAALLAEVLAALADVPRWRPVAPAAHTLPGWATIEVAGVEGEAAMINLDLAGVSVATGSTCALGAAEPAASLLAMGFTHARAASTLRITTGEGVTTNGARRAGRALRDTIERLRRLAR